MSKRRQYTPEELGIENPGRDIRMIRIVVGTMVVLLILGMIFLGLLFFLDARRHEEPVPEQPFMEFSLVHPSVAAVKWHA